MLAFGEECRGRGQCQREDRPAQMAQRLHAVQGAPPEWRQVARLAIGLAELRQHEAGDQRRGGNAGQRIEAELGEAGKAGKKQRAEAGGRGQHTEPDGRPEALLPVGQAVAAGLHEVINRVIHRLADQRRAETDGDAEYRAVGQADRDDAGQRAGNHRQQAEAEQAQRAIDEEQYGNDGQRADRRQAADFALDRRPRIDREQAGAGQLQAGAGNALPLRGFGELGADQLDRVFLAVGVGAERRGLDQQHRPFAVVRGPDAGLAVRLRAGIEAAQQFEHFAGRIARQQGFEHHAKRRGQAVDAVGNALFQAVDRKAFGCHGRAEQIAVAEEEIAVGRLAVALAVLYRDKFGHFAESTAQLARQGGALRLVAAGDGDHQQTRNNALLQLVDQHLLLGARVRGQEEGHVGREAAVPDNGRPGQHGQQPEQESAAGFAHFASSGSMLITARSPSACRYSMLRIWFLLPLTVMRSTRAEIFWSLGSRVSTHFSGLPARLSR